MNGNRIAYEQSLKILLLSHRTTCLISHFRGLVAQLPRPGQPNSSDSAALSMASKVAASTLASDDPFDIVRDFDCCVVVDSWLKKLPRPGHPQVLLFWCEPSPILFSLSLDEATAWSAGLVEPLLGVVVPGCWEFCRATPLSVDSFSCSWARPCLIDSMIWPSLESR